MADNITARDGGGATRTLATKELAGSVHVPKHIVVDITGATVDFATGAKQDELIEGLDALLSGQAKIGTRTYGAPLTRVAYSGTSAQSAAITATEVLLHNRGDGACYVKAGSNPTATVNDIPLEPGEKFHLRITSGDKIAVLQDDTGGNLNIVPVA